MSGPTVFLSAGEASGDLHGAAVARALRLQFPAVRLLGLGGSRMAGEGVELFADLSELAIMGFTEVVRHLPRILRLERRVHAGLARERVDLVIPIDYPGFNLRLARHARRSGIPVLWYIAPQVWAWRPGRMRALARDADEVAVVLPFEEEFLRSAGVRAQFVGHPLLDAQRPHEPHAQWAERWQLEPDRPILALFPGSRAQEVRRHLMLFESAAARVVAQFPHVQPVIGTAGDLSEDAYAPSTLPRIPGAAGLLEHASVVLAKSGTTTLEAALAGTPLVVAYRTSALTYALARRLVKVPHVALANLVAGARVAPELLQDQATPQALAAALVPLFNAASPERAAMDAGLSRVRTALGSPGAAARVARIASQLLADR